MAGTKRKLFTVEITEGDDDETLHASLKFHRETNGEDALEAMAAGVRAFMQAYQQFAAQLGVDADDAWDLVDTD